ncbi:MAG: dipicolinate synthase subunit B [Syntrophomonadaceae bacterium]|jgi:dipicolinate synthase subunit B|nr:dipicolinate synthase subunit B [Syntrophomonadaceae bacterium]
MQKAGNDNKKLAGVKVGIILTGSHCTIGEAVGQIEAVKNEGAVIYPVFSYTVDQVDNRFYQVKELKKKIMSLTDKGIINSITAAEPIGPQKMLDVAAVVPATGNTIAKLANGIIDSPALMAVKSHLRNQRPVVIAVSTNDALSTNAKNIGILLNMKNIYFVPFRQDDPFVKESSLVACMEKLVDSIVYALQGKQLQPLLLGPCA